MKKHRYVVIIQDWDGFKWVNKKRITLDEAVKKIVRGLK